MANKTEVPAGKNNENIFSLCVFIPITLIPKKTDILKNNVVVQ
jgi:hypothetical protein